MLKISLKIKEKLDHFLYGKKSFFFFLLYLSDVFSFLLSFFLSYYILIKDFSMIDFALRLIFFILLILIINYSAFNLYSEKRNLFDENEFMALFYSHLISLFISISLVVLFIIDFYLMLILLTFLFSIFLTTFNRFLLSRVIIFFRKRGYDTRKVFFYGKNNQDLIKKISEDKSLGYIYIGETSDIEELKKVLVKSERDNNSKIDVVFVTTENIDDSLLRLIIDYMSIHWKIIPSVSNLIMDKVNFDEFKDYPIINVSGIDPMNNKYLLLKRIVDLFLSILALIFLSPLFLFIIVMIKLTMPGPIFFVHERLGQNLKQFKLIKFRSMIVDADKYKPKLKNEVEGLFKIKKDPRVTWFGNILRRTSLDELPQIFNIIKGDMSIVGPRPHLESELKYFFGWRRARFQVKPGLTGLWQVNGRHEVNFDKAVLYDIYYIKHMSFVLDIQIILKTIPSIIFSKGRY